MRIALLNGPCTKNFARTGRWQATSRGASLWYPIWLASCHAVLEEAGFQAKLVDAPAYDYSLEKTVSLMKIFDPHLCVIDTSTASIIHDFETARQIKNRIGTSVKICFVGPHASALPDSVIENEFVDFVTIDEYDFTVRDLACRLAKDRDDPCEGIPGLWSKNGNDIVRNPKRPLIKNLDALPFASKSLFSQLDVRRYRLDFALHPYMNIMTSRGCPNKCTYCLWPQTLSRGKYRVRSLSHVFEEIDFVCQSRPKIREIFFDDDTFTVKKERIVEFCERYIQGQYPMPFSVNTRANITEERILRLMKRAGLRCFVVGFESGNQDILDSIKKNVTLEQMETFARLCRKIGIQVHGDFVIGLPNESKASIRNTINFAQKLFLSTCQISIAMPLPGTNFYQWLDEKDYLTTRDFSHWIDGHGMQRCIIEYPNLSSQEIKQSVSDAIKKYYLSKHFFLNAMKQIAADPWEIKRYLWGGCRLVQFLCQRQ